MAESNGKVPTLTTKDLQADSIFFFDPKYDTEKQFKLAQEKVLQGQRVYAVFVEDYPRSCFLNVYANLAYFH